MVLKKWMLQTKESPTEPNYTNTLVRHYRTVQGLVIRQTDEVQSNKRLFLMHGIFQELCWFTSRAHVSKMKNSKQYHVLG